MNRAACADCRTLQAGYDTAAAAVHDARARRIRGGTHPGTRAAADEHLADARRDFDAALRHRAAHNLEHRAAP